MSFAEIEKITHNYYYAGESSRERTYKLWLDRYNRLRWTPDRAAARDALRVLDALREVNKRLA